MDDIQIDFQAKAGTRIHGHGFFGIHTSFDDKPLWWDYSARRWIGDDRPSSSAVSSHAPCRSYKAFIRHLKRHRGSLRGRTVTLVSRWVGHDIVAKVV